MRIRVRLIAIAARRASAGQAGGEAVVDLAEGATPDDALAALELPGDEAYVTLVNGETVPPGARAARRLKENDTLTVFPPLKGG
ncbi:MAG: MoaD/ThiS family protein [Alphaproteobacteria bacterium]